jgi:hypothetical protein
MRRIVGGLALADLAIGLLVLVAYKLQFVPLGEDPYKGFVNVNLLLTSLAAAGFAGLAARRWRDPGAALLAATLSLLALGEVLCFVQDWLLADRAWSVDLFDVAWLAARALFGAMLVRAAMRGGSAPSGGTRIAAWSAAVVLVALGLSLALLPLLRVADGGETGLFSPALLSMDLLLLLLAAAAFHRGGLATPPLALPVLGVTLLLATDLLLYRDIATAADAFVLGEAGYFGGYLLAAWACAGGRPERGRSQLIN